MNAAEMIQEMTSLMGNAHITRKLFALFSEDEIEAAYYALSEIQAFTSMGHAEKVARISGESIMLAKRDEFAALMSFILGYEIEIVRDAETDEWVRIDHEPAVTKEVTEITDERDSTDDLIDEVSAIENAKAVKADAKYAEDHTDWSY